MHQWNATYQNVWNDTQLPLESYAKIIELTIPSQRNNFQSPNANAFRHNSLRFLAFLSFRIWMFDCQTPDVQVIADGKDDIYNKTAMDANG